MQHRYRCRLAQVLEGDLVELAVELGLGVTLAVPIRLYGLDCPPPPTAGGRRAQAFTSAWFRQATDAGVALEVATEPHPTQPGRWLGTIAREGDAVTLNEALLATAHATPHPI